MRADRRIRNAFPDRKGRRAFTLLEVMIVVAILAVVAAMAAPQLMSMVRESRIFRAADGVREFMSETRRVAIDTGIDYEFRYEMNGPGYVLLPTEQEMNIDASGESTTTETYYRGYGELPENIQLKAAEDSEETAESLEPERFLNLDASRLAQKSWSTPILFHFDGTAEDVELRVVDEDGLTALVAVRGLTGSVKTRLVEIYQEEN